ncbi:hypothetical protein HPB51_022039 [Rhipicephalus microplus]|uniref:Tick transposon n=1 Tax=Rhipicephalus microplus TaxID=6941 RepID=A0A9J6DXG7_RHIMP|nr:hypothetical protein HPB51_022039 [Rhipicephalus microplus]
MALLKFISSTSGSFLCSSYNPCSVAPLLIHANCQARSLSFFIRCKHLPDEVVRLFGGLAPSAGHGIRVLKILRSEWHRQARMLKDLLKTSLEDPGRTRHATREWKNLLAIVSSGTEFMWKQTLPGLRASIPKKTVPTTCSVRTTGQVSLPDYVENALKLGPKFAVEPRLSAPELLSLVRRISKCAPEGEANRCISEGVDVISRKNIGASRVPVSRVVSFLKQKRLCVLPADKEGGFVVLGEETGQVLLRRLGINLPGHTMATLAVPITVSSNLLIPPLPENTHPEHNRTRRVIELANRVGMLVLWQSVLDIMFFSAFVDWWVTQTKYTRAHDRRWRGRGFWEIDALSHRGIGW